MTTFDTAKISSIDRIKGRIGLSMRNGLESVGTYPYDIATLREGMSVLIGKVNNSHVILNQIENIPRSGTSYSVRRPVVETGQLLILNFEGEDGATTWVEEAGSGLELYQTGLALDTSIKKFGPSSVQGTGDFNYFPLPIPLAGDFTYHGWFYVDEISVGDYIDIVHLKKNQGVAEIDIYLEKGVSGAQSVAWINDKVSGNGLIADGNTGGEITYSEWHHFACIVHGRDIIYAVDGTIQDLRTAEGDTPFAGMEDVMYQCTSTNPAYLDAVELLNYAKWTSNFTPPTHAPVLGVITV